MGVVAFVVLMAVEFGLAIFVFGRSAGEQLCSLWVESRSKLSSRLFRSCRSGRDKVNQ
jgi:hypothetical protein